MTVVEFAYAHGEQVTHRCDESARGMVVARTDFGGRQEYRVQWGVEKCLWHMPEELKPPTNVRETGLHTNIGLYK
jgi:hypothetical protein